ncbi:MAG TPA: C13 family peptidase [Gallionellaceae bacterium]
MEFNFHQNASDQQTAQLHVQERLRGRSLRQGFWRALVAGVLIGLLLIMRGGGYPGWQWALVILALLAQAAWVMLAARNERNAGQAPEGGYTLNLVPAGISRSLPDGHVEFYAWPEVAALETTDSHWYFHLHRGAPFAVPRAARSTEPEAHAGEPDLAEAARRLWAAHPGHAGQTLPSLPPVPETPVYQALANLGAAARLVFFFKFDPLHFRATWGALAVLLLADVGWEGLTDYIQAQPMPLFNLTGVAIYGVSLLLFFGWALAVSSLLAARASRLRLLVMAQSSLLLISVIYLSFYIRLEKLLPEGDGWLLAVLLAGLLWMVLALVRVVRRLYGKGYFVALLLGGSLLLFSMTLSSLFPEESIYVNAANVQAAHAGTLPAHKKPGKANMPATTRPVPGPAKLQDDDDDDPADPGDDGGDDEGDELDDAYVSTKLDVEDIYYRQPGMVRQVLDGVKPRRAGETALYFVGFAGDASEHEFGNEVRYARNLLDRRFNTAGRSLLLINSYDSVENTPLANTHNMEAVLQGLSTRMDRQNDVLFVFLSSHGAQDHRLAVSFHPLEMNDLKAEKLKQLLDKSGIRNRVIVVSACYSGGFLDVLKDDNTLILTASRRDHVAYGCGDITQYTYFGEAYFVKALEHNDSFIDAFDEARNSIAYREKTEGMEASAPQIHVGRNIGRVLQKLKVVPARAKARPVKSKPQECPDDCPGEPG